MSSTKQAWLVAVGTGSDRLPDDWVRDRSELLHEWPLLGGRYQPGIQRNDRLLYYAAGHQKLIGAGRAKAPARDADRSLDVQMSVVIPQIKIAPSWEVLRIEPARMRGKRALEIDDDQYDLGLEALKSAVQ